MKILNFGSLNIDYTYDVPYFVRSGETLSCTGMRKYSGGKGLNQSVALARCGASVWHAGAVGRADGAFLVQELEAAGVHTDFIAQLDGPTGHAIIQRAKSGENCILLHGGANQRVTRQMADRVLEHFEEGDFLVLQNEISEVGYIMEKAREKGMKIFLNPSPMNEKVFSYPLQCVDCFLLNEVEASGLCGAREGGEALLKKTAERFPKADIVLTLGGEGSYLYRQGRILKQEAFPAKALDTTAAGDTFTGYFIGGTAQGLRAAEAMSLASRAAAIAVSRYGAAPSIPRREEI
ncbi:MAG: ribokinase [Eubacteriales bacterium]|nr:ribokinase [Eubacteriales bacterium]